MVFPSVCRLSLGSDQNDSFSPLLKIFVQIICGIFTHFKSHIQAASLKTYVRPLI